MTSKEKAEDLWLKYYELIDDIYSNEAAKKNAKMYALIAVNEIFYELNSIEYTSEVAIKINYWQEVKQEIEKL